MVIVVVIPIPVVIMIVPVTFGTPALRIFVPPFVFRVPTMLSGFLKFVACVIRLLALAAMMLNGFVKIVICLGNSLLAIVVICRSTRRPCEQEQTGYDRGRQNSFSQRPNLSRQRSLHQSNSPWLFL